ncbi:hypothetical protein LCGC14_1138930, partial [marine sediment metagenome]
GHWKQLAARVQPSSPLMIRCSIVVLHRLIHQPVNVSRAEVGIPSVVLELEGRQLARPELAPQRFRGDAHAGSRFGCGEIFCTHAAKHIMGYRGMSRGSSPQQTAVNAKKRPSPRVGEGRQCSSIRLWDYFRGCGLTLAGGDGAPGSAAAWSG